MAANEPGRPGAPGRRPGEPGADKRQGGGVPDGLLVGGVALLVSLATLTWTSTGLAGLVAHGSWPEGVAFVRTGTAVRSFLTAPRDVAEAWPETPAEQLPSATVLWLVFLTQVVMLFSTVLVVAIQVARWRAARAGGAEKAAAVEEGGLRPPGPPEEHRGADGPETPLRGGFAADGHGPAGAGAYGATETGRRGGPGQGRYGVAGADAYGADGAAEIGGYGAGGAGAPGARAYGAAGADPYGADRAAEEGGYGADGPGVPGAGSYGADGVAEVGGYGRAGASRAGRDGPGAYGAHNPAHAADTGGSGYAADSRGAPGAFAPGGHGGPDAGAAGHSQAGTGVPGAVPAGGGLAAVVRGPAGLVVVDADGGLWGKSARQRGKVGPVHVYDPGHVTDAPVRLRWAPQRGCGDMAVARRRAAALLVPVRPTEPIFQLDAETAETILRCYLHAAAIAGESIQHVLRWAHKSNGAPGKILRTSGRAAPGASMELESALTAHPGRRDAALELIGRALGGLDQLHIRQSCSPGRVDTLALDNLTGEGGTLYVIGDQKETAALRHALVDAVTADQPGLTVIDQA